MMIGTDTPTLTVSKSLDVAVSLNYQFRCIVTDAEGKTVTSDAAKLLLTLDPLTITTQPDSTRRHPGSAAEFTVAVCGGDGNYTYDWQVRHEDGLTEWTSIPNAYNSSLYQNADQYDEAQYRCVITDGTGSQVTSNEVHVIVVTEQYDRPSITRP